MLFFIRAIRVIRGVQFGLTSLRGGPNVFQRFTCLFLTWLSLAGAALAAEPAAKVQQKLYVTNSAGNDVTVIDAATHKPIGRIEVGPNPHGIAVPASQDVIYVTIEGHGRGKPGELLWIDPFTDTITKRMPIGSEPTQLPATPDGQFAYVPTNAGSYEVLDLP